MANQLRIPLLNPIRFVPVGNPGTYVSFYSDWYTNLVRSWESPDNYPQKWFPGTPIKLQFTANFGPVQLDILKCDGSVITSITPDAVPTTLIPTGFTVYEATFNPPPVGTVWYALLKCGIAETLEQHLSEPQLTIPANTPDILTVVYKNSFNTEDVVFATGIEFTFCVEAIVGRLTPKAKRTVWEDQPLNLKTVDAIPYLQFKFVLGNAYGVPDWVAALVNSIFCCDYTLLNGVQYTQVEGAEWEPKEVDFVARQGWRTDIRPTKNKISLVSENNNSPAETFAIVYNIDTRAFGTFNGNPSGNDLQITKVE